jgi:hypothetical protein
VSLHVCSCDRVLPLVSKYDVACMCFISTTGLQSPGTLEGGCNLAGSAGKHPYGGVFAATIQAGGAAMLTRSDGCNQAAAQLQGDNYNRGTDIAVTRT